MPERIEDLYAMYFDSGYYTAGGCLTEKALALGDDDRCEVEAVTPTTASSCATRGIPPASCGVSPPR